MPFHQATYLLLPPPPTSSLPHLLSSSLSSCPVSSSAQRKKIFCLKNKSILPPCVCVCVCVLPLSLCIFVIVSVSLSVAGADRGAVSRCLCQRIQRERERRRRGNKRHSLLFSVCCLCSFTSSRPFYSNAHFFPCALAKHSSLIKLLQISLSLTLDIFFPPRLALSLSLTHANTWLSN